MKFRKFFAMFAPPKPQPVRTPSADPLLQLYEDAVEIVDRVYTHKPRTRAAMAGVMSQPRWAAAMQILRSAGILDERGAFLKFGMAETDALVLVREAINERRRLMRNPKYVAP